MGNEGLAEDLRHQLRETYAWPCTCAGAEMFLCERCQILTSLDAAAAAARQGNLVGAHRAVLRAADIDHRLWPLRDEIGRAAFPEDQEDAVPYEAMEVDGVARGSGPVVASERPPARREQNPNVLYECGLTFAEHKEICGDAFRREAEMTKVGQQHADEFGIHLQLAVHPGCNSTFAWPLPGHRPDDLDEEATRP